MQENAGTRPGLDDRRREPWSGHKQARLLLTLGLAVMLPAAALIYINFYQLQSIERDQALEAAIHRDFQQMLAISEKQINQDASAMAEAARGQFSLADVNDPSRTAAMLDGVLSQRPWLAHVFLFDRQNGLSVRSQPHRMTDATFRREHDQLAGLLASFLPRESEKFLSSMRKKGRSIVWMTESARTESGSSYATTAYFTIPALPADRVAIGGARLDWAYLQQTFFPKVLDDLIKYTLGEESTNPLAMAISGVATDHSGSSAASAWDDEKVLAASTGWHAGRPEISRNLDTVFRGLALGIKFQGTSVAAIGRSWAYRSFAILGVLSVLLVGGLVLTYRSVKKEVVLARLKSDFVSNVSHELRTPLSLIRLYAETLELGRVRPEKMQTYYSTIRLESERLTALIDNILDFSRIEAGRKEYDFRTTDMAELVSQTLDTYRAQIDEQGFTFEQRIDLDLPMVRVDREAIARSVVNLVNNALKYSDRDRFLGVRLSASDGEIKLEVADRGIGIPRDEHAKIFEKFYRSGDSLVHNTKGSGLGLSLVRHIAHAHGGTVAVQSVVGQGSTFTLSLPIDEAVAETKGSAA